MHDYHVIGDVLVTLLASAFLMAVAVVICELSGRRPPKPARAPFRWRLRAAFGRLPQVPADGEPLNEDEQEVFNGYVTAGRGVGIARSDAE